MHAAKYEADKQVLLMYASEAALQEEVLPLPPVLEVCSTSNNDNHKGADMSYRTL